MTYTNHLKLNLDHNKRHFVFGDIHGRMSTFVNLLEHIEYDPTTDIIYSVGDLIDRGPDSVPVIEFFQQENCYVARGNHEQFLCNLQEWKNVWMHWPNGGPMTVKSMQEHNKSQQWLEEFCQSLPIVIDVGDDDDDKAFRIVHAEYPTSMSNNNLLQYLEEANRIEVGETQLLWGRNDISDTMANTEASRNPDYGFEYNPDHGTRQCFSGHTPVNTVVRHNNHWWIDTFRSQTLTCVNALTQEIHSTQVVP